MPNIGARRAVPEKPRPAIVIDGKEAVMCRPREAFRERLKHEDMFDYQQYVNKKFMAMAADAKAMGKHLTLVLDMETFTGIGDILDPMAHNIPGGIMVQALAQHIHVLDGRGFTLVKTRSNERSVMATNFNFMPGIRESLVDAAE